MSSDELPPKPSRASRKVAAAARADVDADAAARALREAAHQQKIAVEELILGRYVLDVVQRMGAVPADTLGVLLKHRATAQQDRRALYALDVQTSRSHDQ